MTTVYKDLIVDIPFKSDKGESFYEIEIRVDNHNLVWLDVAAQEDLQLYLGIMDTKTLRTYSVINQTVIPKASFLTLFSNKLMSDKKIIIRTTKKAVVYYESKSTD